MTIFFGKQALLKPFSFSHNSFFAGLLIATLPALMPMIVCVRPRNPRGAVLRSFKIRESQSSLPADPRAAG